ncbi:GGDEF domain-containing protein [Neptuniibacter halophilus]|uniref:GGDEF domain-containing protein n=1 Tax=Neptuniibacter halophilus TaxID=651666 RepID=UPI002572DCCF|nr:GGDEF domain-containing protein [Neptuniibacter halophilus]
MSVKQHRKTNRLIFGLASTIALLILVNGGFAYWQMQQVKAEFYEVAHRDLPLASQLLPLIDRQFEQTLLIEKLHQIEDQHRRQMIHILEESFIRTGDKFDQASAELNTMLSAMLDSPREATRQKITRIRQLLSQIITEHRQYQDQVLSMVNLMKTDNKQYQPAFINVLSAEEKDLTRELISLRDELQRFTLASAHAVERHEAWVIKGVVIFTLFVFSLGAIMLLMMRQVMRGREQAIEKITYYASYDPLTDLYNRRHFFEQLQLQIEQSIKQQRPLSLCVCDLDHFKQVNDSRGHQMGDQVLSRFADVLKQQVRSSDFIGRFGGDEFVICFPDTEAAEAAAVAERVRKCFAESLFRSDGDSFSVSSTFGVAELDPRFSHEDHLMEQADMALYQAKDLGRNQVYFNARSESD